ncbi:MAG: NAD-dependent epimerase/dehydratase family protein [Candidatus Hermodarchaeota archaeon]
MVNKEILITGTDGFVGSHLSNYFIKAGWDVYGTVYNLRSPLEKECIVNFCVDDAFDKIPNKQFEIVINAAGAIDQTLSKKLMMEINAEGTRRMAEWARKHNCKHFIQISSVAAYGFRLLGQFNTEIKTKRNKGFFGIRYSKSKAKAERYIEKSGLHGYTLLRFPSILGYGDSYISPAIIPRLLKGEFYFSGKQEKFFSTFYIKNIGSLMSKLIDVGPQNMALNCTDFEMTWKEYVAEYARLLKTDLIDQKKSIWSGFLHWNDKKYLLMVSYGRFGAHYPNDKLKQAINWEPTYTWQEGVKEAIKGYSKSCTEYEREIIEKVLDLD